MRVSLGCIGTCGPDCNFHIFYLTDVPIVADEASLLKAGKKILNTEEQLGFVSTHLIYNKLQLHRIKATAKTH